MTSTPAMWHFAGIYLNQDWAVEYGSWQAAVDAFVIESPTRAPQLRRELADVLAGSPTEEQLEALMEQHGAAYIPGPDDGGYRGLLTKIADRVSKASANG